ncbi:hypothetical protein EKL09_25770 [Klebsiella pneumoniae]|nr:hypothetical protein F1D32_21805 [Klebsiella pneumoniae]MBM0454597.1 hypothetical protein [Klebsiella pneumoniae]MBM0458117.1 hypothetical protein [Klebsiella pneumoniae]MBM0466502.1 hypothetical protein [Klebsiella pneumoniae]MBM0470615.1 hypothetical protein [Klebsiella pneumoniae]
MNSHVYYSCASRGATAKSLIAFRCDYYTSNEPYKSSNKYMPGMIFSGRGILPFPVGGVSGNPRKFRHSALWNFLGGWSAA